jgi:predicted nucleotidyltransferase
MADPVDMLQKVAHALGPLLDEVVFVGGTIPALLITDPAAPPPRPTEDVDLVVDSRSHRSHANFEKRLRHLGFQIDAPPACRYRIDGILVDVMTTTGKPMGFSDPWFQEAFATAEPRILPDGLTIKVIRSPLFLATKVNTWRERGNGDLLSQDMEDIVAVVDGRPALLDEVRGSSPQLQAFLAEAFAGLLLNRGLRDAIAGHLGGNAVASARANMAIVILEEIVQLRQPR